MVSTIPNPTGSKRRSRAQRSTATAQKREKSETENDNWLPPNRVDDWVPPRFHPLGKRRKPHHPVLPEREEEQTVSLRVDEASHRKEGHGESEMPAARRIELEVVPPRSGALSGKKVGQQDECRKTEAEDVAPVDIHPQNEEREECVGHPRRGSREPKEDG